MSKICPTYLLLNDPDLLAFSAWGCFEAITGFLKQTLGLLKIFDPQFLGLAFLEPTDLG